MSRTLPIKAVLLALLGLNAAVYASTGRVTETLDAVAWFVLLLLFELETRCPQWTRMGRNALVLDGLRLLAAGAIAWAATAFVRERAWLWIGVIIRLELEVRKPALIVRCRGVAMTAAIALYGGLAVIAAAWLIQGEWFDGYDAVLWIAAFALLELDLLGRIPGAPGPAPGKINN
jgi:hypothetical protein